MVTRCQQNWKIVTLMSFECKHKNAYFFWSTSNTIFAAKTVELRQTVKASNVWPTEHTHWAVVRMEYYIQSSICIEKKILNLKWYMIHRCNLLSCAVINIRQALFKIDFRSASSLFEGMLNFMSYVKHPPNFNNAPCGFFPCTLNQ